MAMTKPKKIAAKVKESGMGSKMEHKDSAQDKKLIKKMMKKGCK